jgi:glycine/D-amino acid oxidase-like deaminating enzyme
MSRAHVIVIGAGVIGANVAFRLAGAGARVTVLDGGAPGGGASATSFAWVNAFNKPPRAYHDLNVASAAEYPGLGEELGGDWLRRVGNLQWEEEPERAARLQRTVERLRGWSYPVEVVGRNEALALEPDLAIAPHVAEIVLAPDEAYVEVIPFVAALMAAAGRLGATFLAGHRVTALVLGGGRVRGVKAANGACLEGDAVIDCAGVAAGEIARLAGVHIPVGREPGRLVYTAPVATTLRRLVHAPGVHFRPDGAGRVVLAEHAHDGVVAEGDAADGTSTWTPADSLASAARHLRSLAGARVEAVRVGVRPMPGDRLPIVGPVPGVEGFYIAVSHSGVTLGPLWGRLVAAEVVGGVAAARLAPFRPSRFGTPRSSPASTPPGAGLDRPITAVRSQADRPERDLRDGGGA